MSKQANKAMIGGFIVGAIALVVVAVLVFGSGRFLRERLTYVLFFKGSVKGLTVGAPVIFRGVRVGKVKNIKLLANPEDLTMQIPVLIEIETGRIEGVRLERDPDLALKMMVERGLRAQLELQSLVTGQLMVQLDFHPDTPIELVAIDLEHEEIPTIRSSLEELSRTIKTLPLNELANRLTSAIAGIDRAVNAPEVTGSLITLNQTLKDIQTLVRNLDRRVDSLASATEETVKDYGKVARNLDSRIEPLAAGITGVRKDVQKLARNLDGQVTRLAKSIEKTSESANTALVQAKKTLASIEGITGKDSAMIYQIKKALGELSAAARSIRDWADYLERHPEALIRGKGK
jgi:paraquat-inducible protein B